MAAQHASHFPVLDDIADAAGRVVGHHLIGSAEVDLSESSGLAEPEWSAAGHRPVETLERVEPYFALLLAVGLKH